MNRNIVRSTLNATYLDLHRMTGGGIVSVVLALVFMPFFTALMTATSSDAIPSGGLSGGIMGGGIGMFAIITTYMFFYEEQGQNRWLNGLIPVGRTHQVLGRYLLMVAVAAVLACEQALCMLIAGLIQHDVGEYMNAASVGVAFVVFLLFESLMYPLLYRFPAQRALIVAFASIFGLFAVLFLLLRFVPGAIDWTRGALLWLAGHLAATVAVVVIVTIAALVVSILCSVRIYRAKEL